MDRYDQSCPLHHKGQTGLLSVIKALVPWAQGSPPAVSLLRCRAHLAVSVWPWELGPQEPARMLLLHPPALTLESPFPPEPWNSGGFLVMQNLRLFTAFDRVMLSQGALSKHTSGIPRLTSLDMLCLRSPPTWTQGLGLCQTHNQGWASPRLYSELLSGSLMDINTAFIYCVFKASRLVSMALGTFVC